MTHDKRERYNPKSKVLSSSLFILIPNRWLIFFMSAYFDVQRDDLQGIIISQTAGELPFVRKNGNMQKKNVLLRCHHYSDSKVI
ncbi:hypothetical protein C5167_049077 [Papaver somniferum]|uniref:Uncharacterized protein n=1 Tax=Papaver somniferum TaxID=3469 RepID=A0A4Y7KL56_PAPSO|nr:hypothetical protein C5167_049077 [Papaver somniferum]